jgi:hypothetical protein
MAPTGPGDHALSECSNSLEMMALLGDVGIARG